MVNDTLSRPPPSGGAFGYASYRGPGKGQTFVDPVFGETIRQLTDERPRPSGSDVYAKNGFWNADGTRMWHNTQAGAFIIDTTTGDVIRSNVPGNFDGSFAPDDPDVWYYFDGPHLLAYSVASGQPTTVTRFGADLGRLGGSLDWIDNSGRYMVLNIGGQGRVYDRLADRLYAGAIPGDAGDGWVAISPDARYVVTTIGERLASGQPMTSYEIDHDARRVNTTGVMFWSLGGDHGDLASVGGKTYCITKESHSVAALYAVDVTIPQDGVTQAGLRVQRSSNKMLLDFPSWLDIDGHISCAGEWAYVSVESVDSPFDDDLSTWRPYKQEIIRAHVVTGEVQRLAHHRSRGEMTGTDNYRRQPRVCAGPSGVAFASNFGDKTTGYADIYAIALAAPVEPPVEPVVEPPAAVTRDVEIRVDVLVDGKRAASRRKIKFTI